MPQTMLPLFHRIYELRRAFNLFQTVINSENGLKHFLNCSVYFECVGSTMLERASFSLFIINWTCVDF